MSTFKLMMGCGVATLLAACGGSGGGAVDASAAPTAAAVDFVPAAASDSTAVFAGWLKQMSGESMENKEAMNTSTFTPKLQDDADSVVAPL